MPKGGVGSVLRRGRNRVGQSATARDHAHDTLAAGAAVHGVGWCG